tara:strand:+ start:24679 stop:25293 length:615 start_codon:yes stop_codon:yes gene_type:complete
LSPVVATRSKRTRLSPVERRAQLVACAISACAEYGLARATHSHVAERAGISVSAVHSYFRTRDDLVTAVLDEVELQLSENVQGLLTQNAPVRDCLENLSGRFTNMASEQPDLIKVWLDWSTGVRADVWPRYATLNSGFVDVAHRLLERGKREGVIPASLDTMSAARLFIGGGHTVALMHFSGVARKEFDIYLEQLVNMIMGQGF